MDKRAASPELGEEESLVLGDQLASVVEVVLYDPATNRSLESGDLILPHQFKQKFTSQSAVQDFGLMVVSDPGSQNETRGLLTRNELEVVQERSLRLSGNVTTTVSLSWKLTSGTTWLTEYNPALLDRLKVINASDVSSKGGDEPPTITTGSTFTIQGPGITINEGAGYTSTSSVTLGIQARGAVEMYLTNTSNCSAGGVWEPIVSSREWALSTTNTNARVYARFRNENLKSTPCYNDSIIHDDLPPDPPTNIDDGSSSSLLTASPSISWTASSSSDLSYYEIAVGSSVGGVNVRSWTRVEAVTAASIGGLSLNDGSTYYASIRAVDFAGNRSTAVNGNGWTVSASSLGCPSGYVTIPANPQLGTAEFCVMKYEARNVGGTPVSQPELTPWVGIARGEESLGGAWGACRSLGTGYDLISNGQWQAFARNIESVAGNWSDGVVGTNTNDGNSINRGNFDTMAGSYLCDSTIEILESGDCESALELTGSTHPRKRTHALSTRAVIWDIAGNAAEWVQDTPFIGGESKFVSQIVGENDQLAWGAAGSYTNKDYGD